MDRSQYPRLSSQAEARIGFERVAASRPVLRSFIESLKLGIGARVLDVGCGTGEFVNRLSQLGFDVVGLDESAQNINVAIQQAPSVEFHVGTVAPIAVGDAASEFDVVVVRSCSAYRADLLAGASLRTTAHLLASLRPGGQFVFWKSADSAIGSVGRHTIACYARHLSLFPGVCRVLSLSDPSAGSILLARLLRRPGSEVRVAVLRTPSERIRSAQWRAFADSGDRLCTDPCCALTESSSPTSEPPRAA